MPTDKEISKNELATIYELRLAISENEKGNYPKEELLAFLDQAALLKR